MKQIPAGEFKASCLAVMDNVQATGEPIVVTKRGVPVVKLVPAGSKDDIFGFMANEFRIVGDVESPVVPLDHWDVLRETAPSKARRTDAKKGKK